MFRPYTDHSILSGSSLTTLRAASQCSGHSQNSRLSRHSGHSSHHSGRELINGPIRAPKRAPKGRRITNKEQFSPLSIYSTSGTDSYAYTSSATSISSGLSASSSQCLIQNNRRQRRHVTIAC